MVDTVRTLAALQSLLADNATGDISAQDVRDMLVSTFGFAQIERQVLGAPAGTITFDSIPSNFTDLRITYSAKTDRSDNDDEAIIMRLGATAVDSGASDYGYRTNYVSNVTDFVQADATASFLYAGLAGGNQSSNIRFGGGFIDIFEYAATGRNKNMVFHSGLITTAAETIRYVGSGSWYNTTDAVDIIELSPETATDFDADSTFTLYGLGTV